MRIAITGSTGLIGTALCPFLIGEGHAVTRVVRRPFQGDGSEDQLLWDPANGSLELKKLEGHDAVIHLAGENIAAGRWTVARKKRIYDSRIRGTEYLSRALSSLDQRPQILVSASAIGFYGNRPADDIVDERAEPGSGFLATVCRDWEQAAGAAVDAGIRVVHPRLGIVLSAGSGALARMLPFFRKGLGGRVGSGRQIMSWITVNDVLRGARHLLGTDTLAGPVNFVSPNPVSNIRFTETLGKLLSRPTILPLPAFAGRLALGEMADELLLGGAHVRPAKLEDSGFVFRHPTLETALKSILTDSFV